MWLLAPLWWALGPLLWLPFVALFFAAIGSGALYVQAYDTDHEGQSGSKSLAVLPNPAPKVSLLKHPQLALQSFEFSDPFISEAALKSSLEQIHSSAAVGDVPSAYLSRVYHSWLRVMNESLEGSTGACWCIVFLLAASLFSQCVLQLIKRFASRYTVTSLRLTSSPCYFQHWRCLYYTALIFSLVTGCLSTTRRSGFAGFSSQQFRYRCSCCRGCFPACGPPRSC